MSAVFFWLTNTMMGGWYWLLLRISIMRCLFNMVVSVARAETSTSDLLFLLISVDELDLLLHSVNGTAGLTDRDDGRLLEVLLRQAFDRRRHRRGF